LIGRFEQDVASEKPGLWCPKNGILMGKNDILMEERERERERERGERGERGEKREKRERERRERLTRIDW